jgi:hypothetical protein
MYVVRRWLLGCFLFRCPFRTIHHTGYDADENDQNQEHAGLPVHERPPLAVSYYTTCREGVKGGL